VARELLPDGVIDSGDGNSRFCDRTIPSSPADSPCVCQRGELGVDGVDFVPSLIRESQKRTPIDV
jgi:hypothetical protein